MLHFASCVPDIGRYQEYKLGLGVYGTWIDPPISVKDGKLIEHLEPRILEHMTATCNWLPMLRDPASQSLADAQFEPVDQIGVGILRRAEDELVLIEHVDEARIALHDARHKVDDAVQHRGQRIRRGKPAADLVQEADLGRGTSLAEIFRVGTIERLQPA